MGIFRWRALRVPVGFLVAPFVAAVVGSGGYLVILGDWRGAADFGTASLITATIVTVLGAMPVHIVLRQHRRTGPISYALAGAALGTTPVLLYLALAITPLIVNHALGSLPVGNLARMASVLGIAGSVSALVFWVIAVRE